jgi:iron complex outermembrane receptor protein
MFWLRDIEGGKSMSRNYCNWRTALLGAASIMVICPTAAGAQAGSGLSGPPQQPSVPGTEGGAPAADVAQPAEPSASTAQQSGELEEIIVTAQKRAENLQKVPISVTAITGAAIANSQINNIQGLANSIPNVQINSFANSPDSAVFTIRGIGVNDADPYVGTTVSVVVDGVVVGVNTAALLSLFDIDRVEILRGPQGTLFGANTTGGVVNVITKQPTGKFGGEAQVVYGNYNRLDLNAALNFPITENLAGKVSVLHTGSDGFFRNYADGRRLGKRDITVLRGYLKFDQDNYDATLIGEYNRSRNGSQTSVTIANPGDFLFVPGETTGKINFKRGFSGDQPDSNDRDSYSGTLTQNLQTGIGKLVSVTNYNDYNHDLFSDDDGTTKILLQTHRRIKHKQFSQELRNHFHLTDNVQMILGGFYFWQKYQLLQDGKLDGFLRGLGQPQSQRQTNWSVSGFAQLYANLTDQLRVQAGIRYSYEKTRATSTTANTTPCGDFTCVGLGAPLSSFGDPIVPGTFITASGKKAWKNVGYKIGLDYQVAPTVLVYGYYARGFKSGGFTGRIAVADDIGPFNPEHVDTFEVGAKTDLLDRHLRVNAAAFYNLYKDMQIVQNLTFPSGANSAAIRNAGKAKSKGFELEVTALPFRGLTLNGSLAYLDANYTDFIVNPSALPELQINFAGEPLINAPKWNATAGFSLKVPVASGELMTTGQYSYTSSKFSAFTNLPTDKIGSVNLVNATMSWSPASDNWSIGVFGRNLFNEKYYGQKLTLPGIGILASLGNPREYGIDFKHHW